MSRRSLLIILGLVLLAGLNLSVSWRDRAAAPIVEAAAPVARVAAGPGLVEAQSEEIRVSAQVGGRLARVLVDEGDRVTTGQVLAIVDNEDYRARLASAEADVALREAAERRVVNGARRQEREEAAANLAEAEATLAHARADQQRRQQLLQEQVVSRAEMDEADRLAGVARARVEAARKRFELVDAEAREEDRARADAEVRLARAQRAEARATYEKTFVRAPIDGIILRRHRQAGETVSTQFDSPVVTMANDARRRVRVDVDEADVAGLAVGQPAYVTADAFGERRFAGRVIRVGYLLGRKNVRTDEPVERVDTKVLETLVELEDGRELPLGLRVQAFIALR